MFFFFILFDNHQGSMLANHHTDDNRPDYGFTQKDG